jgi:adenylate kinase family enzyme
MAEKEELLRRVSQPTAWLVEGVSAIIRQRADLIVFLDVPRPVCLWRCMKRNWRYLFRSRPELPEDCPEYLIFPSLVKMIWQFPAVVGARIHTEAGQSSRYVVIRSRVELQNWLIRFTSAHAAQQAVPADGHI